MGRNPGLNCVLQGPLPGSLVSRCKAACQISRDQLEFKEGGGPRMSWRLSGLPGAQFSRTIGSKTERVMEWRGALAEKATRTTVSLSALETSGTSGSSTLGGEVGKDWSTM